MSAAGDSVTDPGDREVTEGIARVVALAGDVVWLEPEQTSACGGCKAAGACGVQPGSRRLVARRFSLPNSHGLAVGERVVVGVTDSTLLRAALTAYGLPLLVMLVAGVTTQKMVGGDGAAAVAAVAGLAVGLGLVRLWARRSAARGELTPHFIRRASGLGGTCDGLDG